MFIHEHSILNRKNRLFESSTNSSSSNRKQLAATDTLKYQLYRSTTSVASESVAGASNDDGGEPSSSGSMKSALGSPEPAAAAPLDRRRRSHLISVSTVDQDSFVSAQDTVADLKDFEDLEFNGKYHWAVLWDKRL